MELYWNDCQSRVPFNCFKMSFKAAVVCLSQAGFAIGKHCWMGETSKRMEGYLQVNNEFGMVVVIVVIVVRDGAATVDMEERGEVQFLDEERWVE